MKEIKHQKTKTVQCKVNGRSANITTANFILGCEAGCSKSYCYVARWNRPKIYINTNYQDILDSCDQWVNKQIWPKVPDQTDDVYYTADIGCSTDVSYYWNKYGWLKVFDWFKDHPKLKATFATKFVNNKLLEYNPEYKVRIRFSMMPQIMSDILEPNTAKIHSRIKAVDRFIEAGYDVHINLSPIVVYNEWLEDYKELFQNISGGIRNIDKVKFECIFLTHNKELHERNLLIYPESETVLWKPEIQEDKKSQYGGDNIRYQWQLKNIFINEFKSVFSQYFDIGKIRYIF